MPAYTGISTVETRETAWLTTADALPALLTADGGPWDNIQAFWTRTPATQQTTIYVMSLNLDDERTSSQRIMPHYQITLEWHWPIRQTSSPVAEGEQQAMKNASDLLIQRVRGPLGDKTHGGRFLSAGEAPRFPGPHWSMEPPWVTIPQDKELRGTLVYYADDNEVNG